MRSSADTPKEPLDRLRELLGVVQIREMRARRPGDFDAKPLGEPACGLAKVRWASRAQRRSVSDRCAALRMDKRSLRMGKRNSRASAGKPWISPAERAPRRRRGAPRQSMWHRRP
jgi:hypothetical protein